jgi:HEAT repeat protein
MMLTRSPQFGLLVCLLVSGCSQLRIDPAERVRLQNRAMDALTLGVRYEYLPTVRAQAIEALQETVGDEALPWIRHAVHDEHPAVRFAACVALGMCRDRLMQETIREMLDSNLPSDRIAAIFALHRLGDASHTAELAGYLLEAEDSETRSNAALVLGRLGEPGAVKLLARVMNDPDPGIQANALEAMVLLGAAEARSALYAHAYGGIGVQETFALMALAGTREPKLRGLFEQKLHSGLHVETRLAAARGLGVLGSSAGFDLAFRSLDYRADADSENDPAENRTMRVRQMAALTLGAIGDLRALPKLEKMMNESNDPRLQIAAAKAILELVGAPAPRRSSFESGLPKA